MLVDWLWRLDQAVLRFLNITTASPASDVFWDTITHLHQIAWFQYGVLPVLLFTLVYIYGWQIIKPLIAMVLVIAVVDTLCYRVLKSAVDRDRPFENSETSSWVRKAGHAHGRSFPSNHAANCFAGATVLAWYFARRRYYFYTFALLVAISRPALGVHFPSDILAGGLLGFFVGQLIIVLLFERVRWFRLEKLVSKSVSNSGDSRLRTKRLSND